MKRTEYQALFENNKRWARTRETEDPGFFARLAQGQEPGFLFIGCSDSRVPANELTGTGPGEIFVTRNIANQVVPTDTSMASVVAYAVDVLKIEHIIVCGHYGCGGVKASLTGVDNPLLDHWLGLIRATAKANEAELSKLDPEARERRLVELHAIEQTTRLRDLSVVRKAIEERDLAVHAWVYDLSVGVVRELGQ